MPLAQRRVVGERDRSTCRRRGAKDRDVTRRGPCPDGSRDEPDSASKSLPRGSDGDDGSSSRHTMDHVRRGNGGSRCEIGTDAGILNPSYVEPLRELSRPELSLVEFQLTNVLHQHG